VFDTVDPQAAAKQYRPSGQYPLQGRSVAVFKVMPPVFERRKGFTTTAAAAPVEATAPPPTDAPETPVEAPTGEPEPVLTRG